MHWAGYYGKNRKQILLRLQRNRNVCAELTAVENGAAAKEDGMEAPRESEQNYHAGQQSHPRAHTQRMNTGSQRGTDRPMLTAASVRTVR